jgi:hypothetical protein
MLKNDIVLRLEKNLQSLQISSVLDNYSLMYTLSIDILITIFIISADNHPQTALFSCSRQTIDPQHGFIVVLVVSLVYVNVIITNSIDKPYHRALWHNERLMLGIESWKQWCVTPLFAAKTSWWCNKTPIILTFSYNGIWKECTQNQLKNLKINAANINSWLRF